MDIKLTALLSYTWEKYYVDIDKFHENFLLELKKYGIDTYSDAKLVFSKIDVGRISYKYGFSGPDYAYMYRIENTPIYFRTSIVKYKSYTRLQVDYRNIHTLSDVNFDNKDDMLNYNKYHLLYDLMKDALNNAIDDISDNSALRKFD